MLGNEAKKSPFIPAEFVDIYDFSSRLEKIETGWREHYGYSPDFNTKAQFLLSPIKTEDLDKTFGFTPKWANYSVTPSQEEGETGRITGKDGVVGGFISGVFDSYGLWTAHLVNELYDNPDNATDTEWLWDKVKSFPDVEFFGKGIKSAGKLAVKYHPAVTAARAGKMLYDPEYRKQAYSEAPNDLIDGINALGAILQLRGISKISSELVPELIERIPIPVRRTITRAVAAPALMGVGIPGEGGVLRRKQQADLIEKAAKRVEERLAQTKELQRDYILNKPENYLYKQVKEHGGIAIDPESYAGMDKEEINKLIPVYIRSTAGKKMGGKNKIGMSIDEMADSLGYERSDDLVQALRDVAFKREAGEKLPFQEDIEKYESALTRYQDRLKGIRTVEKTDPWEDDVVQVVDDLAYRNPEVKKAIDDIEYYIERGPADIQPPPPGGGSGGGTPPLGPEEGLPKYAGSINLERLNTEDDVKRFILDTSEKYKGKIDEARRGTITNTELKALADELDMTPEQLIRRRKGKAYNAEEIMAAREINLASAEATYEAAKRAVAQDTTENLIKFRQQLERHAGIQASTSGASSEAGRALQAHKTITEANPAKQQAESLKAMLDALGGRKLTDDIAKRIAAIDPSDIVAINKFIRDVTKTKFKDKVFEVWVNSILSGPVTHIVNFTSNALTASTRPAERLASATVDLFKYPITGKRNRYFGESVADVVGMGHGLMDGVRKGLYAFINETPTWQATKIETRVNQAIKGTKGRIVRTPGNLLMAEDEFFKSISYQSELYAQAYRQAAKEGLKGAARKARIGELVTNPTSELMDLAKNEAMYRTFTQPLGDIGMTINNFRNKVPTMKYIIPFLKTPINIAKYGLERTPLEFINLMQKGLTGNLPADAVDRFARATMGSLVGASVFLYAKQGLITGGGPKDKAERDQMYRQGWQPYSIKIGDSYYSYQRLEPLGTVLGLAADFSELSEEIDNSDAMSIATKIAMSVGMNLTNKTFMSGLFNVMNAAADPKRYGEKWTESLASSTVPSFVGWINKTMNPEIKNPEGPLDAIKAKIPILSNQVADKLDVWGNPVKTEGSKLFRALSPSRVTSVKGDAVEKQLKKLKLPVHEVGSSIAGVKLDDAEKNQYKVLSGQLAKKRLDKLVASDDYKSASIVEKQSLIKQTIEKSRTEVGDAVVLPKLSGGDFILELRKMTQSAKQEVYDSGQDKLTKEQNTALRNWYLGEVDKSLKDEVLAKAKGKSKEGWQYFYDTWSQLHQVMEENEVSWGNEKMKKVRYWFLEEVRKAKEANPQFKKEFERYPFRAWVSP